MTTRLPRTLRRALSVFLACAMAWLPLLSVAGLACGDDPAQTESLVHHAPSGEVSDQNYPVHLCQSVCASCGLFASSFPVLQFAMAYQPNSSIAEKVPRLDLPLHKRPPRLI